jgi:predicted small lipoprotein YifL
MSRRGLLGLLAAPLLLALGPAGCGRRGRLELPPREGGDGAPGPPPAPPRPEPERRTPAPVGLETG